MPLDYETIISSIDDPAVKERAEELYSRMKELDNTPQPSTPAGTSYYKLIDTERAQSAIRNNDALYDKEKDRYTRKGERYTTVLKSIDSAQKQGYRFTPTKSGGFTVIDPSTGSPMTIEDSPVQGSSDLDKGLFSFLKKSTANHKAASVLMGNAIQNKYYLTDPEFTKNQAEHETYAQAGKDRDERSKNLGDLLLGYLTEKSGSGNTSPGGSGGKDGADGKAGKDGADGMDGIALPEAITTDPGVDSSLAEVEGKDKWEVNFTTDMGFDDLFESGAALGIVGSLATKGKVSTGLLIGAGISDIVAAALSSGDKDAEGDPIERSVWNAVISYGSMIGHDLIGDTQTANRSKVTKALGTIAKGFNKKIAKSPKFVGWLSTTLKKSIKWITKTGVARGTAAAGVVSRGGEMINRIEAKYRAGEEFTVEDISEIIYILATGVAAYKTFRPGKVKAAAPAKTVETVKTPTPAKTVKTPASPSAPTTNPTFNFYKSPKAIIRNKFKSATEPMKFKLSGNKKSLVEQLALPPSPLRLNASNSPILRLNAPSLREGGVLYNLKSKAINNALHKYANGGKLVRKAQNDSELIIPDSDNTSDNYNWGVNAGTAAMPTSTSAKWGVQNTSPSTTKLKLQGKGDPTLNKVPVLFRVQNWPVNWEDVKLNGAEPSKETMTIYIDKNNPNKIIFEEDLGKIGNVDEVLDVDISTNHSGEVSKAPFLTATGAFRGAVPYETITDSIANYLSYKNTNTVEWEPGYAPRYTPDKVFAAKSMPFEVSQGLRNQVLSKSHDAELLSSDPMANQIAMRRINAGERGALNDIRSQEAEWNLGQINRQEDQERAAVGARRAFVNDSISFKNNELARKLQNLNKNAEIKTMATQRLIDNYAKIARNLFNYNADNAQSIANAEYNQRAGGLSQMQQEALKDAYVDYVSSGNYDREVAADMLRQMGGSGINPAANERLRQAGPGINPQGNANSLAVKLKEIGIDLDTLGVYQ